jgi:amino acid transporter
MRAAVAGSLGAARQRSIRVSREQASFLSRRRLGLFAVLCIGVNTTVGSGVFGLPDDLHRAMGGFSPLAYVFCAILLMPVALSFAELAGRVEETGGAYIYARRAFGDWVGFIIGWFCWINTFVIWAACATFFVTMLAPLLGVQSRVIQKALAIGLIVGLGAVNYFGVKPGARVVALFVIGKLAAIFCFLGVAMFALKPSRLGGALPLGMAGVGQAIYLAIFPLQGFEVAPVTAGETVNPRRNVPLAIMGTLLFSALLYVIVQAVLACSYPGLAKQSWTPLVDAAYYLGPRIGMIVLVGSFISIGGFSAGLALGAPRFAEAIAGHGLLPASLAKIHPRWATPYVAIVATTLLTALLVACYDDYNQLVAKSAATVLIQYLFTCLAVPVIRWREPHVKGSWQMPGGPIIPLIGAACTLALLWLGASRAELEFSLATLVVGVVVAFVSRSQGRAEARPGA